MKKINIKAEKEGNNHCHICGLCGYPGDGIGDFEENYMSLERALICDNCGKDLLKKGYKIYFEGLK
jgi:hypothetical protein